MWLRRFFNKTPRSEEIVRPLRAAVETLESRILLSIASDSTGMGGLGSAEAGAIVEPLNAVHAIPAATTVTWSSAQSGNWNVAANWSDDAVPNSSDLVIINQPGVTVTVSDTESADSLSTASNTAVTITGNLTLAGGTSTIAGTLNLSGTLNDGSGAATLSGTTNWTAGTIQFDADTD